MASRDAPKRKVPLHSGVADPRYGAVYRPTLGIRAGIQAVLKVSDCEEVFRRYSALDLEAMNAQAPVLSYESFLAVIVDFSNRLRNKDIPYLSEGLRDYILNYLARANRITPQVRATDKQQQWVEAIQPYMVRFFLSDSGFLETV